MKWKLIGKYEIKAYGEYSIQLTEVCSRKKLQCCKSEA